MNIFKHFFHSLFRYMLHHICTYNYIDLFWFWLEFLAYALSSLGLSVSLEAGTALLLFSLQPLQDS